MEPFNGVGFAVEPFNCVELVADPFAPLVFEVELFAPFVLLFDAPFVLEFVPLPFAFTPIDPVPNAAPFTSTVPDPVALKPAVPFMPGVITVIEPSGVVVLITFPIASVVPDPLPFIPNPLLVVTPFVVTPDPATPLFCRLLYV